MSEPTTGSEKHENGTAGPSETKRQVRWLQRAGNAQWGPTFRSTMDFDLLGNPTSMGYPNCVANTGAQGSAIPCNDGGDTPAPAASSSYTYNEGLMRSATFSLGPDATYNYHHNLQLADATFANGVISAYNRGTNGMVRPARIRVGLDINTILWDSGAYGYDEAGNIKSIGTDSYTYDAANRLRSATVKQAGESRSESYQYNTTDSMTQVTNDQFGTRTFNVSTATNRLLGIGSTTDNWTYTGAGNTLSANGGAIQFNWDAVNMLTRYREGSKDFVSVYGPGDYRVWVEDRSTGKMYWTSRGANGKILREYEVTGNGATWKHIRDFLYGAEGIVASVDHDGTEIYYHSDHLGTPRLKTSASGGPFSYHHYYPYGLEADDFGLVFEDGFESAGLIGWEKDKNVLSVKYTGHQRERFKNLDYMLGRHYAFVTNRFVSVDPARDGWNLYAYVGNNPLVGVDPTGRATYLVLSGKGYLANDMQGESNDVGRLFQFAAETRADEIRASENFDPEEDSVVVIEVGTSQELIDAFNASYESGPIKSIDVFSHGYPGGLNLGEGPAGTRDKNFEKGDLAGLDPDLAPGASCKLYGCNSGRGNPSIAEAMSQALGIPVTGATSYTWFTNTNPTPENPAVHQVPQFGKTVVFEPRP